MFATNFVQLAYIVQICANIFNLVLITGKRYYYLLLIITNISYFQVITKIIRISIISLKSKGGEFND